MNRSLVLSMTHSLPGAVKAMSALKENVKPEEPEPEAVAAHEFTAFAPSTDANKKLTTSLGKIELTVVGAAADVNDMQYRHASPSGQSDQDSNQADRDLVVNSLAEITGPDGTTAAPDNSVTFSGDFSFAAKVGLSAVAPDDDDSRTCTVGDELRIPSKEDAKVPTNDVNPQLAGGFTDGMYLCLSVDGETVIPRTAPYAVTTKYKGILDAAFPPQGAVHDLAAIGRDGTTFRIPYITRADGYNQRFVIVNRGDATTYSFGEFEMEDGVMVAAGMMASGDLPEGTMVLRASDIVDITGGGRASGTLSIVAPSSTIDAAVQQVNLDTRGVDTVYLVSE